MPTEAQRINTKIFKTNDRLLNTVHIKKYQNFVATPKD